MSKIQLQTEEEYNLVVSRGYEPLLINRFFSMDIALRIKIQKKLFDHCEIGRGDIMAGNDRFFHWVWNHKPHYCEECMKPLHNYSATFCSHILTRGAHPEMSHDPRNINILCFYHHNMWEDNTQRQKMRIYERNQLIIKKLITEYASRK